MLLSTIMGGGGGYDYWFLEWEEDAAGTGYANAGAYVDSNDSIYIGIRGEETNGGMGFITVSTAGSITREGEHDFSGIVAGTTQGIVKDSTHTYLGGNTDFGASTVAIFTVLKYDESDDSVDFCKSYSPTVSTDIGDCKDLDIDSSGNIYAFGRVDELNASGPFGAFLVKLNSSATESWQKTYYNNTSYSVQYGSFTAPSGRRMVVDSSDNVIFTLAENTQSSTGIIKLNSSGTEQWQRTLVGASSSTVDSYNFLATDSSDNVYVTVVDGDGTYDSVGVVKYNSSGTLQWQRDISNASYHIRGGAIDVDSSGNVYVTVTSEEIRGGSGSDTFAYLIKYNSSGTLQWERRFVNEYGHSTRVQVVINGNDDPIIVCHQGSTNYDGYIVKVPSDGTGTGTYNTLFDYESTTDLTDAAGGLTDAAGSATGADPSETQRNYNTYNTGSDNTANLTSIFEGIA